MVFTSPVFLFLFLPLSILFYYFSPQKFKNIVLLFISLFFYTWGEPRYILLMLFVILINFYFGIAISKNGKHKKTLLIVDIIFNLGILFIFKYLNFTIGIINSLIKTNITIATITLPIGISFYLFQIMSYIIDVYRGNVRVQKKLLNLMLYVSLFPQLIAGPIVRYIDFESQIIHREISLEKFHTGVLRFSVGFIKKVLIADQLASLVDIAFSGSYPSVFTCWIGAISYALQIYFDFSGYSDMAIGLGKIFGFDFLENFNYPYISSSIQEFWRRWHISLGKWFRDYLYIPLGGSRNRTYRTCINYVIVFFLTGLWHGASLNFIIWGLFYAFFIIVERLGFKNVLNRIPKIFGNIYSLLVVLFGWVLFRAESMTVALDYIKKMFTLSGRDYVNFMFVMNRQYAFFFVLGLYLIMPHEKIKNFFISNDIIKFISEIGIMIIFVVAICFMIGSGYSPFLYFRF